MCSGLGGPAPHSHSGTQAGGGSATPNQLVECIINLQPADRGEGERGGLQGRYFWPDHI